MQLVDYGLTVTATVRVQHQQVNASDLPFRSHHVVSESALVYWLQATASLWVHMSDPLQLLPHLEAACFDHRCVHSVFENLASKEKKELPKSKLMLGKS